VLLCLGLLIVASALAISRLGDLGLRTRPLLLFWGAAQAAYMAAAWWVLRRGARDRSGLLIVLAAGLLARLALLPSAPTLSEDVYRYLWDGRLVAHGVNPYPHAPSDPALARLRNGLIPRLNHAEVPTIYPPAAQALFAAAASISETPLAWKVILLSLETLLVLALLRLLRDRGLPEERLLLYYWNPLVLVESFGSGHVDLAAAAFLVPSLLLYERRRHARSGILFALAVLTKFIPGLLIPWLLRRRAWILLAVALLTSAILYAPFLSAGAALTTGLRIYARHWEFNSAAYHLLRKVLTSEITIRKILAGGGLVAMLVIAWRARTATGAAFACLTSFLLLSPTVFPWYVVPVVALLPLHPDWGMVTFSGLIALSYLPLPAYHATGVWELPGWILCVEYGGLIAVWAAAALASGSRAGVGERQHPHVEKSEEVQHEEG